MLATWGTSTFPKPTLSLDFLGATSLDAGITFTRASTATYFNSLGVLTSASNNVARFDYNPSTLAPRGLLIEEQRTNSLTYSADFSDAAWTKTRASITSSATTSPSGALNASKLVEDSTASNTHTIYEAVAGLSDNTTYVFSVFLKAGERTNAVVALMDKSAITRGMLFNLSAGTVSSFNSGGITDPSISGIQAIGNGWYRCFVGHSVGTGAFNPRGWVQLAVGSSNSYTGDGTSGLFIWGAQLEAGAFATSYIPTTTTALTRNADVASVTGTNFSSWYRQDEGSLFGQFSLISSSYATGVALDVGAGGAFGTTEYLNWIGTGWSLSPNFAPINVTSSVATTSSAKVIAGIKANDSVISGNGLIGTIDTSCAVPASPTTLSIGRGGWSGAGNYLNGWIARVAYYPVRLPGSTLQALTS